MVNSDIHRDRNLFARIANGDALAFRELFDIYFRPLCFNAVNILKSEYWSEEVVQEALLQVWENRDGLSEIENPKAWLYRIVANKCLDRIRRHDVEIKAQYLIKKFDSDKETVDPVLNHDFDLLRKLLHQALQQLTDHQKTVYLLQQEEGLSYKEIGWRLGISPHTVRNHLIKAFSIIRNYVLTHGEFLVICLAFRHFYDLFDGT